MNHEFPGKNKDEKIFLFIDGQDPAPELLELLRQQVPKLEAGSKAPQGKATCLDISEMKAGRGSAQLRCTVSNGFDGQSHRLWLTRKDGVWVVEKTKDEAIS